MLSVGLVEDHPLFRDGLRHLLTAAGMDVVAEGASLAEATAVLAAQPDILIVDLGLPDGHGHQIISAATQHTPRTRVIVISMAADTASVSRALAAGAHGYLAKDAAADEVVTAIRAVAAGTLVIGASIAPRLQGADPLTAFTPAEADFPALTTRERQILGLIADGLTNADIAAHLSLSAKTVANYVSNLLSTLHAADRAHLTRLVRSPDPAKGVAATHDDVDLRERRPAAATRPERWSHP